MCVALFRTLVFDWFLVRYAIQQVTLQLRQERIQVVRSNREVRKRPARFDPKLGNRLFIIAATPLALQFLQERIRMVCGH